MYQRLELSMKNLDKKIDCTVLISVKNEEKNIFNCLDALKNSFEHVIVLDSFSTDNTKNICSDFSIDVVDFVYSAPYPKKRQWALENLDIKTNWVLLLDADEILSEALLKEISFVINNTHHDGFYIKKKFYFMGKRLKYGGFDFSALMLFKTGNARFERLSNCINGFDMEIHERVILNGSATNLKNGIEHIDWNSYSHYISKHNNYATWEADVRTSNTFSEDVKSDLFGNVQERRRFLKLIAKRIPFEPFLWFIYHYFFRLGFLEGRRGLIASATRAFYIFIVRSKIYEKRLHD